MKEKKNVIQLAYFILKIRNKIVNSSAVFGAAGRLTPVS